MHRTTQLLFNKVFKNGFLYWIFILAIGTVIIFFIFASEMGLLVKIATVLSFLTAPFYAIINYKLISSKHTPEKARPSLKMHILSWLGVIFLIGFSVYYLTTL
jgi:Mn2+/Fe2+ NRAMP family transporter